MNPFSTAQDPPQGVAAQELRERIEGVGSRLVQVLDELVCSAPKPLRGPTDLARFYGIPMTSAARLKNGLAETDPIAALHSLPGPKPLAALVTKAQARGISESLEQRTMEAIQGFESLIEDVSGSPGAFKALLTSWLPSIRADFETERRQSVYRAQRELNGVSCELALNSTFVFPGSTPERFSIEVSLGLFGLERVRPNAPLRVSLVQHGMAPVDGEQPKSQPQLTTNLAGEIAKSVEDICLPEFCSYPLPALDQRRLGDRTQYVLGQGQVGPGSRMDHLASEVSIDGLPARSPDSTPPPSIWYIPGMAARNACFDLSVHRDLLEGIDPTVLVYDTTGLGPSRALDPEREIDRRPTSVSMKKLEVERRDFRLPEMPRYAEFHLHKCRSLDLDPNELRSYRINVRYPLAGDQYMYAFVRKD